VTVSLVGAGPGDPGLLTRRGADLLATADVVVHDRLSAAELLDLAPEGAARIDVGKAPGRHRMAQEAINDLLVELGSAGRRVVRLKGGDPFVFARGSEEAHALAGAGVPYEVVPGITSALAVPAYAGIPVTKRFSSTSFTVVTGHEDPAAGDGSVNWEAIAATGGTLVILMGVGRWPQIAARLLAAGRDPDTPATAVRWGSRPDQQVVRATLATLGDRELASPSVIVVGAVAAEDLDWFGGRPLFGRRIVVTRSRAQSSVLAGRLRDLGAEVVEVPMIRIVGPTDGGAAIRAAVRDLARFDWLVLTSPNGGARTFDAIHEQSDVRALGGVRVAVVGTGTADALARHGIRADLVPERFVAESLLDAMPAPGPDAGSRVLLSVAEGARPVLAEGLAAAGWDVTVAHPYRSEPVPVSPADEARIRGADAATFASSSTVDNLVAAIGADALPPTVVTIGPITSAAARAHGLAVAAEAAPHSIDGLVDAVLAALG